MDHHHDFIFTCGWYSDADTGNLPAWICSASNNSVGWPKNPGRSPFMIPGVGWYTFCNTFNNLSGILSVDLEILNLAGTSLKKWTLSDPTDIIDMMVGGNRNGWFVVIGCTTVMSGSCSAWDKSFKLPIDNTKKCSQLGCSFVQDFEVNTDDWFNFNGKIERVSTGTGNIFSSLGSFHAELITMQNDMQAMHS